MEKARHGRIITSLYVLLCMYHFMGFHPEDENRLIMFLEFTNLQYHTRWTGQFYN